MVRLSEPGIKQIRPTDQRLITRENAPAKGNQVIPAGTTTAGGSSVTAKHYARHATATA